MTGIDWIILLVTLLFIIVYGIIKNRNDKNLDGYLLGNKSLPWYHVGFSVMATQASAITFLSAPGQAFTDGMRFVQFYFGLPLAMILLCITFIPIFHRLKVFTAYEFLENRFDKRTRVFTAFLFLIQRGLSTGISIYAPSIILSTIFGWDIVWTNIIMGGIVLTYTVVGGTKAISYTHLQQMLIVTSTLIFTGYLLVKLLPDSVGFVDALKFAGKAEKMNIIDFKFNPKERYNLWSGLIGGFFLQLSYFGTDQSQVGRYITGSSVKESRMGLIMNGILKIPMQFSILLLGILVFVFYQFHTSPVFFNDNATRILKESKYKNEYLVLEKNHVELAQSQSKRAEALMNAIQQNDENEVNDIQKSYLEVKKQLNDNRKKVADLLKTTSPNSDNNDVNYIFLRFILDHLPHGLIGLLIAVIFSASMGSIASAYNSLAATSMIDVYRTRKNYSHKEEKELKLTKLFTILWGVFCIGVAYYAHRLGSSMIELVNILGSWFYGIILGIFLVAFYFKKIKGEAIFWGALISQFIIIFVWYLDVVGFLWLNPIGCALVISISSILQVFLPKTP